jgi:hypothetical protein
LILADLETYVQWWWYPLVLLAAPVAIFLGAYVLHKSLAKHVATGVPSKVGLGRCCIAIALAVVAAGISGGAIVYMMGAIASAKEISLGASPMIAASIAALAAFALMMVPMFNVPLGQLLPGTGKALGVLAIVTAICATAILVPAYADRARHRDQTESEVHLKTIFRYLQDASSRFTKEMPRDLEKIKTLGESYVAVLKCPKRPDLEIGYFYYSPGSEAMLKANPPNPPYSQIAVVPEDGEGLLACEFKGSRNDGRMVLMRNGNVVPMTDDEFQENLNKKINEDFRKALAKAEK